MHRAMKTLCGLVVVEALMAPLQVAAEPYLALRTGLKCAACHVNRSGGGMRTSFGSIYGQTTLPWRQGEYLSPKIAEFLTVGVDLRMKASGTFKETSPRTSLDLDEAQAYVEARLIRDRVALYLDQTVGPNRAVARELFALIEKLPANGYVKAGKILLPFGLRLKDDGEFIRGITGFNYDTPDQGVEVGIEPGPLSLALALTNGSQGASENDDGKQATATAAFIDSRFRVGVSASRNSADQGDRDVVGGFGGFRVGRASFMGEFDYISDVSGREQLVGFVEGDVLIRQGLNGKVTYGWFDRNTAVDEDARYRMRFGLEAFPNPFIELSAFYILEENIPQATDDFDRLELELRLFF